MKEKMSVEQQVAEMDQATQDKLYKTGLIGFIIQIVIMVPWVLGVVIGLVKLFGADVMLVADMAKGLMLWAVGGFIPVLLVLVVVKLVCPAYSDAKWKYIRKLRKK